MFHGNYKSEKLASNYLVREDYKRTLNILNLELASKGFFSLSKYQFRDKPSAWLFILSKQHILR